MPVPGDLHGPELLMVARRAMENACAEVRSTGGDDGRIPRLMMSVRVMAAIASGERDAGRLKIVALRAVDTPPPDDGPTGNV